MCSGLEGIAKFHTITSPSDPVISVLERGRSDADGVPFGARDGTAVDPVELDDEDGIWYDANINSPRCGDQSNDVISRFAVHFGNENGICAVTKESFRSVVDVDASRFDSLSV
mmetsp:Transcript_9914/g.14940  ORF Transcript_9914/g.14940 Transcript_9914/m.14940 type:complete len:113 (-) Transcript_9914:883-1221(-)